MSRPIALLPLIILRLASLAHADLYAGRVVGPDDRPVSGARVVAQMGVDRIGLTGDEPLVPAPETVTNADGRFTLEYTPPAPVGEADAEAALDHTRRKGLPVMAVAPANVPLGPGGAVLKAGEENTLRLTRPGVYMGTLRDETGQPLVNVRLHARDLHLARSGNEDTTFLRVPAALRELFSTRTDATGAFRLERVPLGGSVGAELDDPLLILEEKHFARRVGEPARLRARRGGTLSGRVVDASGKPVANTSVSASSSDAVLRGGRRSGQARTRADGTFQIPSLPPGTYTVELPISDEKAPVARVVPNVPVVAGRDNPAPTIQTIMPAWITGTVLDARTQKPLRGATVTVQGTESSPRASAWTGNDGRFRLPVVSGRLEVTAQAPSRFAWEEGKPPALAPLVVSVRSGETRSLGPLAVDPGEVLQGRMVDESGAPVPGEQIIIGRQRGGGGILVRGDAQGRFSFSGLRAGTVYLQGEGGWGKDDEWKLVAPRTVALPSQGEVIVTLRHTVQFALRGRMVTPEGKPVAGVKARFKHEFTSDDADSGRPVRSWSHHTLHSEADGTFTLKGLTPDSVLTLEEVEKDGYVRVSGGEVRQRDGEFRASDIVLRALSTRLQGVVTDTLGRPVPDALVWSPALKAQVRSDGAGRFSLPAADAEVELWAARGRAAAHINGHGQTLMLTLREPAPVPERAAARALPLLREVASELDPTTARGVVRALAPINPRAALEIAPRLYKTIAETARRRGYHPREDADGARRAVIQAWSQGHRNASAHDAREVLTMLDEIENAPDFIAAATSLGIALAKDLEAARLLERAAARLNLKPKLSPESAVPAAHLATLAATLGAPSAEQFFGIALAVHEREPTQPDLMGIALAQGPADLVRRFAAEHSPQVRPSLMNGMPTSTRLIALNYAIPVLAPHDPEAAYQLLLEAWELHETAFKGEKRDFNEGWIAGATRAVMHALGPTRPDLMPGLARRVRDPWHRASILALGAKYSKAEDARELLSEATAAADAPRSMRAGAPMMARLAGIAQGFDPKLAAAFLRRTLELRAESEGRGSSYADGEIAYYLSAVSPEDARALLETEWAHRREIKARQAQATGQAAQDGNYQEDSPLTLALAPLDWERAVAWARTLEPKSQKLALGRLALWALQTREERGLFRSDDAP